MKRSAKPKLQMLFRVTANGKEIAPCMPRNGAGQVRVPDGKQILSLTQALRQPALIPRRWLKESLRIMYADAFAGLLDAKDGGAS